MDFAGSGVPIGCLFSVWPTVWHFFHGGEKFFTSYLQSFASYSPYSFCGEAGRVQDVIFCLFRSFRPKFYRTFCRSRQDLTIHARPVTRLSETHLRNVWYRKCNTPGRCPAYAGKIIPHPGTLKGVPRMGELAHNPPCTMRTPQSIIDKLSAP